MLSTDLAPADVGTGARRSRLIVTRRGAVDATYRAIGYLDRVIGDNGEPIYEFGYLASATRAPEFVPIVGFRDLRRRYRSTRLFPSFADRVMSAKRPDRPIYLEGLDLRADADAWEILTASGGYREGDPIELISLPMWNSATHETSAHLLAHGVRHLGAAASKSISELAVGQTLQLQPEPTNETNSMAIRIVRGSLQLGYVPDPLLGYVHSVLDCGAYELAVVRANSVHTHPHLRLLLCLTGRCERLVFDGPEWAPVT